MSQMQGDNQHSRGGNTHREGEVIIDKVPDKKKNSPKNAGEYVDFEEIKE